MAKSESSKHRKVHKKTKQGGDVKHATMNKQEKRNFKKYRGQGR